LDFYFKGLTESPSASGNDLATSVVKDEHTETGVLTMTSANSVLLFLKGVITEMKDVEEDDIGMESTLAEIALDSLDYVEIQLAVKKQYSVDVSQNAFLDGSIKTMQDFCSFVCSAADSARPTVEQRPALQPRTVLEGTTP